jgi:hypothetical protein
MTMLTDGLKSQSLEEQIKQMDVAELLEQSCAVDEIAAPPPAVATREVAEAVPAE